MSFRSITLYITRQRVSTNTTIDFPQVEFLVGYVRENRGSKPYLIFLHESRVKF